MTRIIVLGFLFFISSFQGRDSIVDAARRNGGTAVVSIDLLSPIGELSYVTTEADTIVRGIVGSVKTRLSDDETIVITEYGITPTKFYKGSFAAATSKPGATVPLIVQRPGGSLDMDNLHMETVVNDFPENESSLVNGDEVVLFLARSDTGRFRIHRGPFGAFRVVKGNVTAMTKGAAERRHDEPRTIGEFEQELHRHLSK